MTEHKNSKHETNESENVELKLELLAIVNFENDVLEARQTIIEKLNEQNDVEKVKTVYIDKNDTFFDMDDIRWNTVEIVLTTSKSEKNWKEKKFRQNMFSKCYLWETVETILGENKREYYKKQKEELRKTELRGMGYVL